MENVNRGEEVTSKLTGLKKEKDSDKK